MRNCFNCNQEKKNRTTHAVAATPKGTFGILGVPIDGHIDVFINLLEQKWISLSKKEDNKAILSGDFAGYDDCKIYVYYSVIADQRAWRVDVEIPSSSISTWSSLEADYIYLKDGLTEKYGTPRQIIRRQPFYDRHGNIAYVKVSKKDYEDFSLFDTENGKILLGIANLEKDDNKFGIRLSYIDTENEQKKTKPSLQ